MPSFLAGEMRAKRRALLSLYPGPGIQKHPGPDPASHPAYSESSQGLSLTLENNEKWQSLGEVPQMGVLLWVGPLGWGGMCWFCSCVQQLTCPEPASREASELHFWRFFEQTGMRNLCVRQHPQRCLGGSEYLYLSVHLVLGHALCSTTALKCNNFSTVMRQGPWCCANVLHESKWT